MNKSEIAKELGRNGGKKTAKLYGTSHYKKMAEKRWKKKKLSTEKEEETIDKPMQAVV